MVYSRYKIRAAGLTMEYFMKHIYEPKKHCMTFHLDYARCSDLSDNESRASSKEAESIYTAALAASIASGIEVKSQPDAQTVMVVAWPLVAWLITLNVLFSLSQRVWRGHG